MGENSLKKTVPFNWRSQPITRSGTILNRVTYNYEPGQGMIKNEDIQRKILNSLANKPRRILTREIYLNIFQDCEVHELKEPDERTSTELIDMSSIESQASESENLVSNDSSLYELPILPITRSGTILNKVTYNYEPGKGMIKNEDIQRKILNSLAEKPRRILTREIYRNIFQDCEVQELKEPDERTSTELIDMNSIESQASEYENLVSHDSSLYELNGLSDISNQALESESVVHLNNSSPYSLESQSDVLSQALESESMVHLNNSYLYGLESPSDISSSALESKSVVHLNNSSPYGLGTHNNLTIPDTSCGSISKPGAPVQKEQADFQPPEKEITGHSKRGILDTWIENSLDIVLPYIP